MSGITANPATAPAAGVPHPVPPAEVPPLPPAVLAELPGLPNGRQLPQHRDWLMAQGGRFGQVMAKVERDGLPPRAMAELWLWLVHLAVDMGSRPDTTGQTYGYRVARFLHWCAREGLDFAEVDTEIFDRWQRWLAVERRNGASYRAQQIAAVRNFYDWRRSRGLAPVHLAADVRGPRIKPKPPRKYTDDQLRALFRSVEQSPRERLRRDKAILLLFLAAGLRREEMARLSLSSLELTRRRGVVHVEGKGAKERQVPFEGPVVEALTDWLEERAALAYDADPDALWLSTTGGTRGQRLSIDGLEGLLKTHARAAKLRDWGIHRFRVTFATQLYDDGADIETIRALMGHESIETTRRYLAVSERARRTRLSADRQHRVLGTRPTGRPLWARLAAGELIGE